jgi:hypothetical protein
MHFRKQGDNVYDLFSIPAALLDSGDNYDVSADGMSLIPKPHKLFTKLQFRCLFTMEELVGIDNYTENATLSPSAKATMLTILTNFGIATQIDLLDPRTQQGVNFIESIGLIAPGRAAEILGATT